jgi:hypothetical protein
MATDADNLQRLIAYQQTHFHTPDLVGVMRQALRRRGVEHHGHYIASLDDLDRMLSEGVQTVLILLAQQRRVKRQEQRWLHKVYERAQSLKAHQSQRAVAPVTLHVMSSHLCEYQRTLEAVLSELPRPKRLAVIAYVTTLMRKSYRLGMATGRGMAAARKFFAQADAPRHGRPRGIGREGSTNR